MKAADLLDDILLILREVKEDKEVLQKILDFLQEEVIMPDEEEYTVQLPERYNAVVKEIAGNIDAGQVCFLNTDTLEIDDMPYGLYSNPEIYEMETGMTLEEFNPAYTQWEKYITIEPLESNESFRIMSKYADQLDNSRLRTRLVNALNNRRPFANFKLIIENSDARKDWFSFKDKYLQDYVKALIEIEIQDELQ